MLNNMKIKDIKTLIAFTGLLWFISITYPNFNNDKDNYLRIAIFLSIIGNVLILSWICEKIYRIYYTAINSGYFLNNLFISTKGGLSGIVEMA